MNLQTPTVSFDFSLNFRFRLRDCFRFGCIASFVVALQKLQEEHLQIELNQVYLRLTVWEAPQIIHRTTKPN